MTSLTSRTVEWIVTGGVALLVTVIAVALLLKFKEQLPLDHPNHRSLHRTSIPRTGGIAILSGILIASAMARPEGFAVLLAIAIALGAISFFDDAHGLPVGIRFLAQLSAASALILAHAGIFGGGLVFILCILTIVWMTNVYNFMDGSDGLAAGMTVFGFGAYAIGAWSANATGLAFLSVTIAGAGAGFLIFNFHPARIFMGDVGSIPLGFLAGGIGMMGWMDGVWPLGFPAVVFSPFLVDATVTLAVRLLGRQRAWQAHRSHFYQKIILMGFGHQNTALAEYVVMLVCGIGGVFILNSPDRQPAMIAIWVAGYAILLGIVELLWQRRSAAT